MYKNPNKTEMLMSAERIQLDMRHNTLYLGAMPLNIGCRYSVFLHLGVRFYRNQGYTETQIITEIFMTAEKIQLDMRHDTPYLGAM